MPGHDEYESPLVARYASQEMCRLFGARHRILTWRRLWLALAQAQRRAGLKITWRQIAALKRTIEDIRFPVAARYEKRFRHDVMAHVHAWGDVAPEARGILHLGAASMYVVDNADLIIMRDALRMIADWLANVIDALAAFAKKNRALPTLGLTHYQPAQVTTVGKRAALWCYDFIRDLDEIEQRIDSLRFRGVKGTTGTQASFLALFDGDHTAVKKLEQDVAKQLDFIQVEPITGQTYSRKVDAQVVCTLGGIAASAHKFANDMRLLANLKEVEEPFEKSQIGSSSMAYKRNPMRCERATGLARFVLSLVQSPLQTAAEQWFERTLDDSANKRISVSEAFLATDAMLKLVTNVSRGLVVYPKVIAARLDAELPFMASENILMAAASAGGDRQELHERVRRHSHAAAFRVKMEGRNNDLLERLRNDEAFADVDLREVTNPKRFVGRAPQQVDEFLKEFVTPVRRRYRGALSKGSELSV
ncbi:MAG: adenylosuccinate lyase [Phycisphaerales bacterium]|nr:MAG: adenylosuccinate lyase [Phycisphaerales bacterium]